MSVIFMYDSIVLNPPANAEAVAGYVAGSWPDYNAMVRAYPHAKHVSISPFASVNARILDIEPRDATPDEAASWLQRQLARGEALPGIYVSASSAENIVQRVAAAGISRDKWVLWTAHYTGTPHISQIGEFGLTTAANATQYTDHANGLNLDESECDANFFPGNVPVGPWRPDWTKFDKDLITYERANGQVLHLYEAQTLQQHYGAPAKDVDWLAELSHRLVWLRKRVWYEAHKNMGPAGFGTGNQSADWRFNRGYRWKELLRATDPVSFNRLFPHDPHGAPLK